MKAQKYETPLLEIIDLKDEHGTLEDIIVESPTMSLSSPSRAIVSDDWEENN